jgi:type I restriction enzyme M protein
VDALRAELLRVKQKLTDLGSDMEALTQQQEQELDVLTVSWTGSKGDLRFQVNEMKASYKINTKTLKQRQKEKAKRYKVEIKRLEKEIPTAERELKLLTNRGKLELILEDSELIGTLKERWIAAEVAKRLDYPIFMAVSERGGKNNSGDYEYVLDADGHLVEDTSGQPKIDQDLVNYDLAADELADAVAIADDQLCVAEAFVRFAQQQGFDFWRVG